MHHYTMTSKGDIQLSSRLSISQREVLDRFYHHPALRTLDYCLRITALEPYRARHQSDELITAWTQRLRRWRIFGLIHCHGTKPHVRIDPAGPRCVRTARNQQAGLRTYSSISSSLSGGSIAEANHELFRPYIWTACRFVYQLLFGLSRRWNPHTHIRYPLPIHVIFFPCSPMFETPVALPADV